MKYLEDLYQEKNIHNAIYKLMIMKNNGKNSINTFNGYTISISNLIYRIKIYSKSHYDLDEIIDIILNEIESYY